MDGLRTSNTSISPDVTSTLQRVCWLCFANHLAVLSTGDWDVPLWRWKNSLILCQPLPRCPLKTVLVATEAFVDASTLERFVHVNVLLKKGCFLFSCLLDVSLCSWWRSWGLSLPPSKDVGSWSLFNHLSVRFPSLNKEWAKKKKKRRSHCGRTEMNLTGIPGFN